MGASTGIGALIVGVAMLSVFVLANSALDAQIESGIERMEKARGQDSPSFAVDDASNDVNAIDSLSINTGGSGYGSGGTISATSLDSVVITTAGLNYAGGDLEFTDDCAVTSPAGTYGVSGLGAINSITLTAIGEGCTSISVTPEATDAGDGNAILGTVLASSLGFSGTYTQSGGAVNSVTIVSAGQGFSRVPVLSTSGSGGATFTVGIGNVLTFNLTNNGNENMEIAQIWFSLDGDAPKRLDLQTYTEWDFPKYEVIFPGETQMIVFDLSGETDTTPERIAATCMGGISAKDVVENS